MINDSKKILKSVCEFGRDPRFYFKFILDSISHEYLKNSYDELLKLNLIYDFCYPHCLDNSLELLLSDSNLELFHITLCEESNTCDQYKFPLSKSINIYISAISHDKAIESARIYAKDNFNFPSSCEIVSCNNITEMNVVLPTIKTYLSIVHFNELNLRNIINDNIFHAYNDDDCHKTLSKLIYDGITVDLLTQHGLNDAIKSKNEKEDLNIYKCDIYQSKSKECELGFYSHTYNIYVAAKSKDDAIIHAIQKAKIASENYLSKTDYAGILYFHSVAINMHNEGLIR
jgi:hypothetical protein